MVEWDSVKVKDQLGRPEDKNITVKRYAEEIIVEDNPLHIKKQSLGNSWIVGSSTNGLVGTNTGTVGGGQQVVGPSSRTEVLQVVASPDKIFREHFYDNFYANTGSTTADWAVTPGQLSFTNTEIAVSNEIAYNHGTITKALLTVAISSGNLSDLSFELTADGASNWENITHASQHTFTNTGTDLRFRITASGTVTVTSIRVEYS